MINPPLPVSELLKSSAKMIYSEGNFYQITLLKLYEGVNLMSWYSHFSNEQNIALEDDSHNIYFSFNLNLRGVAQCCFCQINDYFKHTVFQGCGGISYHPAHRGSYVQKGELENITLIINKEVLPQFINNYGQLMAQLVEHNGYINNLYLPELHATARQLYREMTASSSTRNHLWFQGNGLVFTSLFMEALTSLSNVHRVSTSNQYRLTDLKNYLLSNLSHPPTIAQLAKLYGFSASTLTRNFRRVFGCSINEMLQQERMTVAHQRLLRSEASVTEIAIQVGYSNVSHFSHAFHKHFGILPRQVKLKHPKAPRVG